jgi:hypothetical protein
MPLETGSVGRVGGASLAAGPSQTIDRQREKEQG